MAGPFQELLERLRAGDEDAARQVYHRFAQRLIACAEQRLGERLRQKEDPEDVVQSVFQTFYRRVGEGQFRLDDWDSLGGLLLSITIYKCLDRQRRYRRDRRDVAREQSLVGIGSGLAASWEPMDRELSPEEAALQADLLTQALRDFDDRERQIVDYLLEGRSVAEIGSLVGCSESTLFRVQRRFRRQLDQLLDQQAN